MFGCFCRGFLSEYKENVQMGIGRCSTIFMLLPSIPQKTILNQNIKAEKSFWCNPQKITEKKAFAVQKYWTNRRLYPIGLLCYQSAGFMSTQGIQTHKWLASLSLGRLLYIAPSNAALVLHLGRGKWACQTSESSRQVSLPDKWVCQ